jgi:hypothetical protein
MEEVDEAEADRSRAEFATCAACDRKWDLSKAPERASILSLKDSEGAGSKVY